MGCGNIITLLKAQHQLSVFDCATAAQVTVQPPECAVEERKPFSLFVRGASCRKLWPRVSSESMSCLEGQRATSSNCLPFC